MTDVLHYAPGSPSATSCDPATLAELISSDGGLVWIDTTPTEDLVPLFDALQLNEFVREDIANSGQRTKLVNYSGHSHVAVYDCALHDDGLRTRELDIVFGDGWFLSVRQQPDDGDPGPFPLDHVRHVFELQVRQHQTTTVGLLLWAFLDTVVDRYFHVTEAVDDRLDDVEEAVLAEDAPEAASPARPMQLFALGKALVRFRRAAIPLRDVVQEIVRREVSSIDDRTIVHFQDLADHVLRVGDFVESQRDVLTSLRDAELALASNRMSLVQQKIAAWGAIFLVATLVTGFLGMNFRDAPNISWGEGFLLLAATIVALSVPMYAYFKRRKWL